MAAWYMLGGDQYSGSAEGPLREDQHSGRETSTRWHFGYSAKVTRPAGLHVVRPPQGDIRRRLWRVAGWGALSTLLVFGVGLALERLWLGPTDQTALAHVAADVQDEFAGLTRSLATTAQQLARQPDLTGAGSGDVARTRALFDLAARLLTASRPSLDAVSVYDSGGRPVAWAGRPSTPPVRPTIRPLRMCLSRRARWCSASCTSSRSWPAATRPSARRRRRHRSDPSARRQGARSGRSPIFESALAPLMLREVYAGARRDALAVCVQVDDDQLARRC